MAWSDLRNKVIISVIFGIIIVAVLALYVDLQGTLLILGQLSWSFLFASIGLTLVNYGLRFVKWHYYLGLIGASQVSVSDSLKIFVAGFTMVMTPGKLGEFYKAWVLNENNEIAVSRAAPVILAERITDGLAMAILASAGLALSRYGAVTLVGVFLVLGIFIAVVQVRPIALWLLSKIELIPFLQRFAHSLREFYESTYQLFGWKSLVLAVGLGLISWGAEGLALYLILLGLGLTGTMTLLLQSITSLSLSTILGAISFLPGGLGVTDGSLTGMLLVFTKTSKELAVAATLVIRLVTLWFGVVLGISTLIGFRHQLLPNMTEPIDR